MPVKKISAASIRLCARVLFTACAVLCPLSAQPAYFFEAYDSGIYGIADRHFRGVLFPEVCKSLPSVKAAYPGLWEADRAIVGAGVLPDQIVNSSGLGWNALYVHTDIPLSSGGSAGLWLGNANIGDSFQAFEYYDITGAWDISEFSLRGAFWISPSKNNRFQGISAAFDVDNFYANNGSDFGGIYDDKSYYLNINTLVRLNDGYRLRVALRTRNKYADNPEDTRDDDNRHFTDAVSVGLLDCRMRTLELTARNTFAVNNALKKSDTVALSLRYTRGAALSYMKHKLFIGLTADAGLAYPSKISQSAGSFLYYHYLRRMTGEGRLASAGLAAPVIADVDLSRGLRCMLSIRPKITYTNTAPLRESEKKVYLKPQHRFATELSEMELSFMGAVGDRVDFILMPSIKNDVFFSALEARYRF
ncbi:MAG: hypothetical protein LBC59_05070 [Chitinispirillales bacterium]|jgi:hypothetical protein|nr:hypothetical protein [Chitinispirillales bacterium]